MPKKRSISHAAIGSGKTQCLSLPGEFLCVLCMYCTGSTKKHPKIHCFIAVILLARAENEFSWSE